MITSEYLEQVVNFDQPILAVGPGADFENPDYQIPMDRALYWFIEKLASRKCYLDIVDLPPQGRRGGQKNLLLIKDPLDYLAQKLGVTVNGFLGDLLHPHLTSEKIKQDLNASTREHCTPRNIQFGFPQKQYGFIWDHGTSLEWTKNQLPTIIQLYYQRLLPHGKIVLATHKGNFPEELLPFKKLDARKVILDEDKYQTSLSLREVTLGIPTRRTVLQDGFLFPYYRYHEIMELTRKD